MNKTDAARLLAEQSYMSGWRPRSLLSRGNAKLAKSERTIGLSLAPAKTSGYEVCASRSPECSLHCIHTSGMASPNCIGRLESFNFDSLKEMNAFILGIEEAAGYLDTHFVEE